MSNKTEGTAAAENMSGGSIFERLERLENGRSEKMNGGVISEFHERISALETSNADLSAQLDAAKGRDFGVDAAHVNHVMMKHFAHDRPDPDDASKAGSG